MIRFVVRRLLYSVPIIVIVPFLVFLLISLAPGDAAQSLAGENATEDQIQQVRERLHLDDPLLSRFGRWAGDAIHGDFGRSLITQESVGTMIKRAIPVTLSFGLMAVVLAVVVGVLSGVLAALRPNGVIDRLVTLGTSLAIAIPSFWFGLILVLVVAVQLGWLPAGGYVPLGADPVGWFKSCILPAIALATLPAAEMSRQTQSALQDELGRDYALAARARGVPARTVVFKHTLKNAGVPVITVLGFRLAQMLGGSVIIESVFALNGIGTLMITAATGRDIPTLLGIVSMITVVIVVINLLVDLSYGYFNPRVRAGNTVSRV